MSPWFWQLSASRPLATYLLIGITLMLILGSFLPNPDYLQADALVQMQSRHPLLLKIGAGFNSRKMATGYLFGFIGIYLILSSVACSIERFLSRRRTIGDIFAVETASTCGISLLPATVAADRAFAMVRERLGRLLFGAVFYENRKEGLLVAQRGRYGFYGSLLFHSVLVTALMGLVLFYLGGARGKLAFTEGQGYPLEKSRFVHLAKEPLWGLRLPQVDLELLQQYSTYDPADQETVVDHVARFKITDRTNGKSAIRDLRINEPLRLGGADFLLISGGFAPRLLLTDQNGRILLDTFVNLKGDDGTRDGLTANEGRFSLQARLFPDLAIEAGRPVSRSMQLKNPAVALTVRESGKMIYDGIIPLGGSITAGAYTLAMPDVRRWVELEMADEPGIGFFFIMAFFGIFGLLLRMLDPEERLIVRFSEVEGTTSVEFFSEASHFPALLTEVAKDCQAAVAALAGEDVQKA